MLCKCERERLLVVLSLSVFVSDGLICVCVRGELSLCVFVCGEGGGLQTHRGPLSNLLELHSFRLEANSTV